MVREPQDVGLARVGSRQAKGKHRRFRAGRREPHPLGRGHKPLHQSRPLDLLTVAGAQVRPTLQRIGNGLKHLRPPVAEQQGAVAHHVVNVLVAVDVPLAAAVGVGYDNGERHHVAGVVGHPIGKESTASTYADADPAWFCAYCSWIVGMLFPLVGVRRCPLGPIWAWPYAIMP